MKKFNSLFGKPKIKEKNLFQEYKKQKARVDKGIKIFDLLFGKPKIEEKKNLQELKRELKEEMVIARDDRIFSRQVDRNLKGIKYEKGGKISLAIELYEKNISENFGGNHPYDRLSIIYRKQKDHENEIRVLNKAIEVFSYLVTTTQRVDVKPKLDRFRKRLEKMPKINVTN